MSNKGTFNQQITGFHSKKEHNKYLFYLLKSMARVMLNVASYTTLPILNNEFFKSFWIVIPSKNEQPKIVSHIETQSTKIDEAISQQQTQIEKLKEYKATLIDSAVTGKIKVS
jgi:type I restriction enzyme S subunit